MVPLAFYKKLHKVNTSKFTALINKAYFNYSYITNLFQCCTAQIYCYRHTDTQTHNTQGVVINHCHRLENLTPRCYSHDYSVWKINYLSDTSNQAAIWGTRGPDHEQAARTCVWLSRSDSTINRVLNYNCVGPQRRRELFIIKGEIHPRKVLSTFTSSYLY